MFQLSSVCARFMSYVNYKSFDRVNSAPSRRSMQFIGNRVSIETECIVVSASFGVRTSADKSSKTLGCIPVEFSKSARNFGSVFDNLLKNLMNNLTMYTKNWLTN